MEENPLISIILPVYNGEKYLATAIASCLNQTYKNIELVLVDDCSNDDSLAIAKKFAEKDKRILIVSNEVNKKLPATLNIGHKKAKGNYITWTSDDNILKPDFIAQLFKSLITHKADITFANYDVINEAGNLKRVHKTGPVEHLFFGNKIGAAFLYKKSVFMDLKGYDESLYLLEDYDFWLRAGARFKFYHLNESIYQYRLHSSSLTSKVHTNEAAKLRHKEGVLNMFDKISKQFNWHAFTFTFITDHVLNNQINIFGYFQNKHLLQADLVKFNAEQFNVVKVIYGIKLIVRKELISNHSSIKTLFKVLKKDNELLFHNAFSKKQTLRYFINTIFRKR